MPNCWLERSTKYVMFVNDDDQFVITFEGKMDNNYGAPIESDGINNAARGFFFRDSTFGFESLDGFVVYYDAENYSWKQTSMTLPYNEYNYDHVDKNLTTKESNGDWFCEVALDPTPSPTFEHVACSRVVPEKTDYETLQFRYQSYMVVSAIGYSWSGDETQISEWAWGGLVTLEGATYLTAMAAGLMALQGLNLF